MDKVKVPARVLKHRARVRDYSARIRLAEMASRDVLSEYGRGVALGWYRIERARLEVIASDIRAERGMAPDDLPAATVIAAAATLSPATSWAHLMADLPAFIAAALDGHGAPPFATYGAQRVKAAKIVRDRLGIEAVTGPKVSAFARALSGDASAVVIDRHAARIATGDDTVVGVGLAELRAMQEAYGRVAESLSLEPSGLQALVWVARVGFGGEYGNSPIGLTSLPASEAK